MTTTLAIYPPIGSPMLVWSPVSDATKYRVQLCDSTTCDGSHQESDTENTRWAPPDALKDGWWWWRVLACDNTGCGTYSDFWSFQKSWTAGGTLGPTLLSPDSDAVVEFFEPPIFSWTSISGAAAYRLRIYTASACATPLKEYEPLKASYSPRDLLSSGEYWWQVAPLDRRNNEGSPSECRHFTRSYLQEPTLLAPTDWSTQMFTPEFSWTAVKGAREYRLQVNLDSLFPPGLPNMVIDITTHSTRYTPPATLDNEQDYFWRVAAIDTSGTLGPWVRYPDPLRFHMAWHLVPHLLSPTPFYTSTTVPLFRWTPVAGAKTYEIQVDNEPNFTNPIWWFDQTVPADSRYNSWSWKTPLIYDDPNAWYYWRVRARDGDDHYSIWSDASQFQFKTLYGPLLVYPAPYYDPNVEPSVQPLDVRTDPLITVPVFMWDRAVYQNVSNQTDTAATAYEIQVSADQNFYSVDWTTRTANLSITPAVENGFALASGLYYWRVRGLVGVTPLTPWSEAWPVRFDTSLQHFSPTLALYFPADGWNNVYDTPLFAWSPVQGAAWYAFEVYTSTIMAPVHVAHPLYGFYTPQVRLAPDTYYWRVRAQDSGGGYIGEWSPFRRLVITYQLWRDDSSHFDLVHPLTNEPVKAGVGQDPPNDATLGYDLTGLYVAEDRTYWYLALDMPVTNTEDMYFGFYIDLDQQADSGGTYDRMNLDIGATAPYSPEVAVYAHHLSSGQVSQVVMTSWYSPTQSWGPDSSLTFTYHQGQYLEVTIPKTALSLGENWLGVVSVEAFAAPSQAQSQARDTVPRESNTPTDQLTNFTAISDRVNPLYPWDNPFSNPFIAHMNPAVLYSRPLPTSWISGYNVEVDEVDSFSAPLGSWEIKAASSDYPYYFHLQTSWTWKDNTYPENPTWYWRVRAIHDNPTNPSYGPWSQPVRFTKSNFLPVDVTAEYTYTTPTFRWDRIEGVDSYTVMWDRDPSCPSPNGSQETTLTSWTPRSILEEGTWYWCVRVKDGGGRSGDFVRSESFTKTTQPPILVSPISDIITSTLPTLRWQPVLYPTTDPVLNSIKYHVQMDDDENFSSPYVWEANVDTTALMPDGSLKILDGTYYWRVQLVNESNGIPGTFSAAAHFYKYYPAPNVVMQGYDPSVYLTWDPLLGAAYYKVDICLRSDYTQCESKETVQVSYVGANTGFYKPVNVYYWRVRMCDRNGACGNAWAEGRAGPHRAFIPLLFRSEP
jgi:hypothetical protein